MNLRPGIAEAVDVFWRLVDARVPPIVRTDEERATVNAALLVALGKIHSTRDQNSSVAHTCGDPRENWATCPACQELLRKGQGSK